MSGMQFYETNVMLFVHRDKGEIVVYTPYSPTFLQRMKERGLKGRFDRFRKAWIFPIGALDAVKEILLKTFGTDGTFPPQLANVRINLSRLYSQNPKLRKMSELWLFDRMLAKRWHRDAEVQLGVEVSVVEGGFPKHGGSRNHPSLDPLPNTILEVTGVPHVRALEECERLGPEVVVEIVPQPPMPNEGQIPKPEHDKPVDGQRIVLCDLDNVILRPYEDPEREPEQSPNLEQVLSLGSIKAICTNQDGLLWNLVGGRPNKKYPDWPKMIERLLRGMSFARTNVATVALYHPEPATYLLDSLRTGKSVVQLEEIAQGLQIPYEIYSRILNPYPITDSAPIHIIRIDDFWIYVSWRPGWTQPNEGMFLHVFQTLEIPPSKDVLYLSANPDGIVAAQRAGITGVLLIAED